jgi:hypothetical protein
MNVLHFSILALGTCALTAADSLQWAESGMWDKRLGYRPIQLQFVPAKPEGIKKLPEDLEKVAFSSFQIGPAGRRAVIYVAMETKDGKLSRLFVDGNANGDLTDDPPSAWTEKRYDFADKPATTYWAEAKVSIPFASGAKLGQIKFYKIGALPGHLERPGIQYFADYALTGKIRVGERAISGALLDSGTMGEFIARPASLREAPTLWLDLDGDGLNTKGETFPANRPFKVDGKWWALSELTPEGSFQVIPSAEPPKDAVSDGPNLSPGQRAPTFAATLVDGKPVNFPRILKAKWCCSILGDLVRPVRGRGAERGEDLREISGPRLCHSRREPRQNGRGARNSSLSPRKKPCAGRRSSTGRAGTTPSPNSMASAPSRA